jgi:phosphonate transport system permease protein
VTLLVPVGEHLALLGNSGSGKTTLINTLARQVTATSGTVHAPGCIAVVHQDLRLVKQRTALQNVLHGAMGRLGTLQTILRFPAAERTRATRLLIRVGLGHRIHHRVGRLSGGEQQRVAIARALMQDPAIILADEPVASLDMENARSVMTLLRDVCREHRITLVSVLHDCNLAHDYADRIIGLVDGRIVHDSNLDRDTKWDPCHHARLTVRATELNRRDTDVIAARDSKVEPRSVPSVPGIIGGPDAMSEDAGRGDSSPMTRGLRFAGVMAVVAVVYVWAFSTMDVSERQLRGMGRGLTRFITDLWPRDWSQIIELPWSRLLWELVETMQMSLIGTTFGVLISWPLASIAARNVGPAWIRVPMRQVLNAIRTIPSLIWALLFVAAVGFGSLAGVAALIAYSIGYLTKFFYEGFEGVDPGPPSALKQIGASGTQRFLHAIWPAAQASVLSSSIFMLEYNVRAASVLGIVDAGGIGTSLKLYLDYRDFPAAIICLALLLAVVIVLDAISTRIRARIVRN